MGMQWYIRSNLPKEKVNFRALGLSELEYRILLNRKISDYKALENFLNPSLDRLYSPFLMKDIIQSGNIISKHLALGDNIRIIGDYDVDGVMSTTILMRGLGRLGAKVDYKIPHRIRDGYGISSRLVEEAYADGIQLIITCDNGIAAFEALEKANELGIDIILTDHHDLVTKEGCEILPPASTIINPKQKEDTYPFKALCGGAVAFKLMHSLYTVHGLESYLSEDFLPYVALATVCDVMPLIGENRILVKEGLEAMEETNHLGLRALINISDLAGRTLKPYHLGFVLGPTINSVGRLEDANQAVELFLTEEGDFAESLAGKFKDLNTYRQDLTNQAIKNIEEKIDGLETLPKILMLVEEDLHESIAGIVAGRIKEKTNHPTVVLTKTPKGLKGSGRSVEPYNMSLEFSKFRDELNSFGGHAMACGLSLEEKNFPNFYKKVLNQCQLTDRDLEKKIYLDAQVPIEMITMDLINSLKKLEPYGVENPQPTFGDLGLKISDFKILGKNRNVIKFIVSKGNASRQAIYFGDSNDFFRELNKVYPEDEIKNMYYNRQNNIFIDIVYRPNINEYNNNKTIQLVIDSYRFKEV